MRILIDGVFFQLNSSGIARVWSSVLPRLAKIADLELFMLDRGGAPRISGITTIPFPAYRYRYTADDSILIQKMCDYFSIDIFTSTYYTSPTKTPMLLTVYDMIPELFNFDLSHRHWQEKQIAISYARRILSISKSTKSDILKFYPEIPSDIVSLSYLGCDKSLFFKRSSAVVDRFRRRYGLKPEYFVLVGSRSQWMGYKNADLFFDALSLMRDTTADVLCIGGEKTVDSSILAKMPSGARVVRVDLPDDEVAQAYSGAIALVYPSRYEGFGLPVIEAMACGCPVVTTTCGSLRELAGDGACVTIDPDSVSEMIDGLLTLRHQDVRDNIIARGLQKSSFFTWDLFVNAFLISARRLKEESVAGEHVEFLSKWKVLREIQASVDTKRMFD